MDPISIVGTVVGVAGFGLQLAQFLTQFADQVLSADENLHSILQCVEGTSKVLFEVEQLLEQERKNIKKGRKLILFSKESISKIRTTSDDCLRVFWRIEAVILNKDKPKILERRIEVQLTELRRCIEKGEEPPDLKLSEVLSKPKLTKLQQLAWVFSKVGDKLERHRVHLQGHQTTLILLFHVISLRSKQNSSSVHHP